MPIEITYASFQRRLDYYVDRATNAQDVVVVRRRGNRGVAIIDAEKLRQITEEANRRIIQRKAVEPGRFDKTDQETE
jgi:PHD/YefM family antitoxin component YafN of YafNO toxin-antitoxin module